MKENKKFSCLTIIMMNILITIFYENLDKISLNAYKA